MINYSLFINAFILYKADNDTEEEWKEFSKIKFNLGRHFVDVIHSYNEKLTMYIIENCSALEDSDNVNAHDKNNW